MSEVPSETNVVSKFNPEAFAINLAVLKSLSRAEYSPKLIGHYALASEEYCHFTSPIRRYADLLVHRGLIKALGLGQDGLTQEQASGFADIGERITETERLEVRHYAQNFHTITLRYGFVEEPDIPREFYLSTALRPDLFARIQAPENAHVGQHL